MINIIIKIVITAIVTIVVLFVAFILFIGFLFREDTSETESARQEYRTVILPALNSYFASNNKYPNELKQVVEENSLKYRYSYRIENSDGNYGGPACTYELGYVFQSVGLNNFRDMVENKHDVDRCYDKNYLELYELYKIEQASE